MVGVITKMTWEVFSVRTGALMAMELELSLPVVSLLPSRGSSPPCGVKFGR